MTGLTISHYRILEKLGEGGKGIVWKAEDINMRRVVALKFLHASDDLARLLREAQTAGSLSHPNICTVYEVDPEHGFIAMEYVEGCSLANQIAGRPLLVDVAVAFALQIGEGLREAHEKGITHRDIKSANIIVNEKGQAKILDFGLAKVTGQPAVTYDGLAAGTPGNMAPEQLRGEPADARTDIWALGAVLHEMLTGRLPIAEVGALPQGFDRVVRKALAAAPAERYQHVEDFLVDLRQAGTAWRPLSVLRFRRWLIAAAIVIVIAAGYWVRAKTPYRPKPASVEWYRKGINALLSTTYESARKALEQAVANDPGFALAHAGLAQAYEELDYTELAKESMLKAVTVAQETHLSTADARRLRAFQHIVAREYERAAPLLQQMESSASAAEKPAAALECGWLAQRADKTAEALQAYQRALKLDPGYAPARLRLGHMLHRRRQLDAALNTFQEAERLYLAASDYEGVTEALWGQANLLIRSNRAAAALPLIDKALSAARTVGSSYLQIRLQLLQGVASRYLGEAGRAGEIARRAIDAADAQHMDNLASSALVDLGNSYLVRRDVTAAEPVFHRALDVARRGKVRRHEARALLALASICEQARRPAEGRKYIEAVLPFYREAGYRREVIQAMIIMGGIYSQQAEYENGIRMLRGVLPDAVQLRDATVEAQVRERLADALRDQGDWPSALEETERAASLLGPSGQSLDVRLNVTHLRWRLGRRADALQSLAEVERLLKRHPNPLSLFELMVLKAEIAYEDGRISETATLARQALGLQGISTDARSRASLLLSAALIRGRRQAEASAMVVSTLDELDRAHRALEAAQAHLLLAEALMEVGQSGSARGHALRALAFFGPRRIVEATWRAHLVVARASGPDESGQYRQAANSALASLKSSWPAADVRRYLERADIRIVLGRLSMNTTSSL